MSNQDCIGRDGHKTERLHSSNSMLHIVAIPKNKIKNSIVIPFILGKMGNIHPENLSKIIFKKMNYCQFRYTTYFLFLKSEITV